MTRDDAVATIERAIVRLGMLDRERHRVQADLDGAVSWLACHQSPDELLANRDDLLMLAASAAANDDSAVALERLARSLGDEVTCAGVDDGVPLLRLSVTSGADLNHLVAPLTAWSKVAYTMDGQEPVTMVQVHDPELRGFGLVESGGCWHVVTSDGDVLHRGDLSDMLVYVSTWLGFDSDEVRGF